MRWCAPTATGTPPRARLAASTTRYATATDLGGLGEGTQGYFTEQSGSFHGRPHPGRPFSFRAPSASSPMWGRRRCWRTCRLRTWVPLYRQKSEAAEIIDPPFFSPRLGGHEPKGMLSGRYILRGCVTKAGKRRSVRTVGYMRGSSSRWSSGGCLLYTSPSPRD